MDDLLIAGGRVVSVLTGEVFEADVTVTGDTISGVLPPGTAGEARERIDATGLLIAPGFVDAHMHVESSFLVPETFAELALPHGTTTVLADPHELVNVVGADGLRWLAAAGRGTPMTMLFGVPSCVPSLPGFETAGAELDASDVELLLREPGVVALGEVMDYRAVVSGDQRMRSILDAARPGGRDRRRPLPAPVRRRPVHVPRGRHRFRPHEEPSGRDPGEGSTRHARAAAGEVDLARAHGRSAGAPAVAAALPGHGRRRRGRDGDAWTSRPRRAAGRRGRDAPLEALRAITLAPARRLRLYDRGTVTPGRRADLVLLRDVPSFRPVMVIAGGRVVARDGVATWRAQDQGDVPFGDTVRLAAPRATDFEWHPGGPDGSRRVLAIRANATDTSTLADTIEVEVRDGVARLPAGAALLTIVHRHGRTRDRAFAPVVGLDLADGAAATTYAHDSHNLLVLGTSPESMAAAATAVVTARGGVAVAERGSVTALLRLPVGGLMSTAPGAEVAAEAAAVRRALDAWGYRHSNAFMSLATLSLPVSPSLKLTDRGLVDVERRDWAAPPAGQSEGPAGPGGPS